MYGAGLARFHDELVQPLRIVFYVFAATKAIDRKPQASYNVFASSSTACSIPSESLNDTRHDFTREG
jgi:hypothetical protein